MARVLKPARGPGDGRLTEERIYAAALRLIDADGVEALSMRRLAAALDVNPMSLYHHVPNKAALLRGVTNLVATEFGGPDVGDATWQEQLRQLARNFRSLARRHSKLVLYAVASPDFIQREDPLWVALCHMLRTAKVPDRDVTRVGAVLLGLVSGFLMVEFNGTLGRLSATPAAGRAAVGTGDMDEDADRSFEFVVQTLIAGLSAQICESQASPAGHPTRLTESALSADFAKSDSQNIRRDVNEPEHGDGHETVEGHPVSSGQHGRHGGRPKIFDHEMITYARALRARGVPVPDIARQLIIPAGKNKGKNPSVASVYRILSAPDDNPS